MSTKAMYKINEIGKGKVGFSTTRSIIEATFYSKIIHFFILGIIMIFISSPITASAATNYVITIEQFKSESKSVAREISSYYSSYIEKGSTCDVKVYSSTSEFINIWNSIATEDNIGMIVINAHGGPDYTTYVYQNTIVALEYVNCDYLYY